MISRGPGASTETKKGARSIFKTEQTNSELAFVISDWTVERTPTSRKEIEAPNFLRRWRLTAKQFNNSRLAILKCDRFCSWVSGSETPQLWTVRHRPLTSMRRRILPTGDFGIVSTNVYFLGRLNLAKPEERHHSSRSASDTGDFRTTNAVTRCPKRSS